MTDCGPDCHIAWRVHATDRAGNFLDATTCNRHLRGVTGEARRLTSREPDVTALNRDPVPLGDVLAQLPLWKQQP